MHIDDIMHTMNNTLLASYSMTVIMSLINMMLILFLFSTYLVARKSCLLLHKHEIVYVIIVVAYASLVAILIIVAALSSTVSYTPSLLFP